MAAEPKSKTSKQRRNKRRSSHWKLRVPGMSACSKCGDMVIPHRMCKACGSYKGRTVIETEA